jgi:1-acyl-sn-glycerol-3-phosphate acyltransferase
VNAATLQHEALLGGGDYPRSLHARHLLHRIRVWCNALILAALFPLALADAAWVRLVTTRTGCALAHARAAWLHRWCRIAARVLGLRVDQRGFTPVSGMLVGEDSSLQGVVALGATRPCVFVAGDEVKRWPLIGTLAELGGTLFIDSKRRQDAARINFMIERAISRRLVVVVFPGCGPAASRFASALLQPAAALRCTLTAAAIQWNRIGDPTTPTRHVVPVGGALFPRCRHFLAHSNARATITFGPPAFRRGDRKELARQLRCEVIRLRQCAG